MRALLQRVTAASVVVDGEIVGSIDGGFLVLLGVHHDDSPETAAQIAEKIATLRVFNDPEQVEKIVAILEAATEQS